MAKTEKAQTLKVEILNKFMIDNQVYEVGQIVKVDKENFNVDPSYYKSVKAEKVEAETEVPQE